MKPLAAHNSTGLKRKRFLSVFFIVLLVIAGICAVVTAVGFYALSEPDRVIKRNPVMSVIQAKGGIWNEPQNLIPAVFNQGDGLASVAEVLKQSKFSPGYYQSFGYKVDGDTKVWTRRYGTFACNMEWAVFLKFNTDMKLVSADGTVDERGCL